MGIANFIKYQSLQFNRVLQGGLKKSYKTKMKCFTIHMKCVNFSVTSLNCIWIFPIRDNSVTFAQSSGIKTSSIKP